MKTSYKEFDAALLENIKEGKNKMILLDNAELRAATTPFMAKDRYGRSTPSFRIIDRRLQALRKAGTIKFTGKVWEII